MAAKVRVKEGKIILKYEQEMEGRKESELVMEEVDYLLNVERFLNGEIAQKMYKRFKLAMRVHIFEGYVAGPKKKEGKKK